MIRAKFGAALVMQKRGRYLVVMDERRGYPKVNLMSWLIKEFKANVSGIARTPTFRSLSLPKSFCQSLQEMRSSRVSLRPRHLQGYLQGGEV